MAYEDFEIIQPEAVLPPLEEVWQAMPAARLGLWSEIENQPDRRPYTSLDFAKALQRDITGQEFTEQHALVAESFDELDRLAVDIKERRAAVRLEDGHISGDIGGYTVTGEHTAMVTLRMHEIAHGIKQTADYKENGVRLAGPIYVPVLAVRSLALLRR